MRTYTCRPSASSIPADDFEEDEEAERERMALAFAEDDEEDEASIKS